MEIALNNYQDIPSMAHLGAAFFSTGGSALLPSTSIAITPLNSQPSSNQGTPEETFSSIPISAPIPLSFVGPQSSNMANGCISTFPSASGATHSSSSLHQLSSSFSKAAEYPSYFEGNSGNPTPPLPASSASISSAYSSMGPFCSVTQTPSPTAPNGYSPSSSATSSQNNSFIHNSNLSSLNGLLGSIPLSSAASTSSIFSSFQSDRFYERRGSETSSDQELFDVAEWNPSQPVSLVSTSSSSTSYGARPRGRTSSSEAKNHFSVDLIAELERERSQLLQMMLDTNERFSAYTQKLLCTIHQLSNDKISMRDYISELQEKKSRAEDERCSLARQVISYQQNRSPPKDDPVSSSSSSSSSSSIQAVKVSANGNNALAGMSSSHNSLTSPATGLPGFVALEEKIKRVQLLKKLSMTQFNPHNDKHINILSKLWSNIFTQTTFDTNNEEFLKVLGFNSANIGQELSLAGILSLHNLFYFSERHPQSSRRYVREGVFPFVQLGVKFTQSLVSNLLDLVLSEDPNVQVNPMVKTIMGLMDQPKAFEELFCIALRLFFRISATENSNAIIAINDTLEKLYELLRRNPRDLNQLLDFAKLDRS